MLMPGFEPMASQILVKRDNHFITEPDFLIITNKKIGSKTLTKWYTMIYDEKY